MLPARAFLVGTVAVGVLDILDALVFFGLRGVPPHRIFQGIAAGLLGRAAFSGGLATAVLGGVLHFCIAGAVAGTYLLASRRLAPLRREPYLYGPLYGLAVYAVMNYVVIPLSAITAGPKPLAQVVNGLAIHAFGVGLPSALAARAAQPPE